MSDGTIIERLNLVAADLGVIEKEQISIPGQTFQAFTVDTVYRHLRPLFAKHGVVVIPEFVEANYGTIQSKSGNTGTSSHVTIRYRFYAPDGSDVSMVFSAEGHDYQDKATNKAAQQAFKYGLIQMFQISTGEIDPDAAVVEASPVVHDDPERARVKRAAWEATGRDVAAAEQLFVSALAELGYPVDVVPSKMEADELVSYIEELANESNR